MPKRRPSACVAVSPCVTLEAERQPVGDELEQRGHAAIRAAGQRDHGRWLVLRVDQRDLRAARPPPRARTSACAARRSRRGRPGRTREPTGAACRTPRSRRDSNVASLLAIALLDDLHGGRLDDRPPVSRRRRRRPGATSSSVVTPARQSRTPSSRRVNIPSSTAAASISRDGRRNEGRDRVRHRQDLEQPDPAPVADLAARHAALRAVEDDFAPSTAAPPRRAAPPPSASYGSAHFSHRRRARRWATKQLIAVVMMPRSTSMSTRRCIAAAASARGRS